MRCNGLCVAQRRYLVDPESALMEYLAHRRRRTLQHHYLVHGLALTVFGFGSACLLYLFAFDRPSWQVYYRLVIPKCLMRSLEFDAVGPSSSTCATCAALGQCPVTRFKPHCAVGMLRSKGWWNSKGSSWPLSNASLPRSVVSPLTTL